MLDRYKNMINYRGTFPTYYDEIRSYDLDTLVQEVETLANNYLDSVQRRGKSITAQADAYAQLHYLIYATNQIKLRLKERRLAGGARRSHRRSRSG